MNELTAYILNIRKKTHHIVSTSYHLEMRLDRNNNYLFFFINLVFHIYFNKMNIVKCMVCVIKTYAEAP